MKKDIKLYAPKLINEQRRSMKSCGTEAGINAHFECACRLQGTAFPASCANKDCRFCFLEKEKNIALDMLRAGVTINVSDGNVTINININGKEAK